ncbi:MAG: hypothetical protein CW716_12320 [Candidatus Bathyarchaeum sp.]|nr:MAG: hypothetical protein CW716_12320 [Candidatus Bathyarchaeum sp.]
MTKKLALNLVCLAVLVGLLFSAVALADDAVGVKEGHWIEYRVITTGDVPEGHDVAWTRMEVVDVEGQNVSFKITLTYSDNVVQTKNETVNLETDNIMEGFIIPANLDAGEDFESNEGNLTVNDVKEETYAGANRNIVFANTSQTQFSWDRSTGVLVEANASYPTFAIVTKVERTNMWQAQIFGIDPFVFSVPIIAMVIAVLAFFMIRKVKN